MTHHKMQTDSERSDKYLSLKPITQIEELCVVCTQAIKIQSFKGTGVCSELCRKTIDGDPIMEPRSKGAS